MEKKKLVTVHVTEKERYNFRLECLKRNVSMSKILKTAIKEFVENKKN